MAKKRTKAIQVNGVFKTGQFKLGWWGAKPGSTKQDTHDGDTVSLSTPLNFSSRFLGIDAPEVSFTIRTKSTFVGIGNQKWKDFWTSGTWKTGGFDPGLIAHLQTRIGSGVGVAENHETLARIAEDELETMIDADWSASDSAVDFNFFLAFGHEVLDGYGRMLCYMNADRDNFTAPAAAHELSYNERLLETGAVVPYFIF